MRINIKKEENENENFLLMMYVRPMFKKNFYNFFKIFLNSNLKRAPAILNIKKSLKRKKRNIKTLHTHTQSENNQHRLETTNKKEKERINKITLVGRSTFGSPFFNKIWMICSYPLKAAI